MPPSSLIPHSSAIRRKCRSLWAQQARNSTTGRKPKLTAKTPDTSKNSANKKTKLRPFTAPRDYNDKRPIVITYKEPPVFIPGTPVKGRPYYAHTSPDSTRGAGTYREEYTLPTFNVAALLDPEKYCRKSAFYGGGSPTRHGTAAMRRLLQGKESVLRQMRDKVRKEPPRAQPWSYAIIGHGVPPQLLQDHLNMADSLLSCHGGAAECSFRSMDGDLMVDCMKVRRHDGSNRMLPWPPASKSHQYQMELYLAVMKRLVSSLGLVLSPNEEELTPETETLEAQDKLLDDDDFVASPSSSLSLRHWDSELVRGEAYPSHLLPSHKGCEGPMPIVQWSPRNGSEAPGNVCIRLQGFASDSSSKKKQPLRRKKRAPVSLVFDARIQMAGMSA